MLESELGQMFVWYPHLGIGRQQRPPTKADYFDEYARKNQESVIGTSLTAFRKDLCHRYVPDDLMVVDVGIGDASFINARPHTFGTDIDPKSVEYLKSAGLWWDTSQGDVTAMTFWDSLEHIPDPSQLLAKTKSIVLVSLPIFDDLDGLLHSKHYKPCEHYWYFTRRGLDWFMKRFGFTRVYESDHECRIGREGVGTFAFQRTNFSK